MIDYFALALALCGSVIGAYLGVKITVTRLETEMVHAKKKLEELDVRTHKYKGWGATMLYAMKELDKHDKRITTLEQKR